MRRSENWVGIAVMTALLMTGRLWAAGAQPATTIYTGGTIITMNPAQPQVEAVAVRDGKILAVGRLAALKKSLGVAGVKITDLQGKTMLPGFIDGHSHFSQVAASVNFVDVSPPPISRGADAQSIVTLLKESPQFQQALKNKAEGKPALLIGYGYDETTATMPCFDSSSSPCRRGMTHDDLDDPVFQGIPIILIHVSMHGGLLNKAALETSFDGHAAIGLTPDSELYKDCPRKPAPHDKELVGLLMEAPWLDLVYSLPAGSLEDFIKNLAPAQQRYASYGYTTAHDSPIESKTLPFYFEAAKPERRALYLDIVGYADEKAFYSLLSTDFRAGYTNHFRLAGVKAIVDGSPQGRTAMFTAPYMGLGPNGEPSWLGNPPNITQEDLNKLLKTAYDHHAQVMAHVNGDGAVAMLLQANKEAGAPKGVRTTPIHSQFVTRAQLAKYVLYQFTPSFFTSHAYFWGDIHVTNLGPARANFLSPMKSASRLGLHMTNHSDAIVTPPDPLFILWSSLRRVSRTGKVIGKDEQVTPYDGLKALTLDGAYQYFEEKTKGSIEVNKVADLVILDGNPLKMGAKPNDILRIAVLETIKDGAPVFTCASPCAPRRDVDAILGPLGEK